MGRPAELTPQGRVIAGRPDWLNGVVKRVSAGCSGRSEAGYDLLTVGMMNQPATFDGRPIMKRLAEGIEHKARMGRSAYPPTDDTAG